MEFYVFSVFALIGILSFYLTLLSTVSLFRDTTLNLTQRIAQLFVSLLIPIFGSILILHLIAQHSPEAIPYKYLPWPFRRLVFERGYRPNQNRDEKLDNAIDLRIVIRTEQRMDGQTHSTTDTGD